MLITEAVDQCTKSSKGCKDASNKLGVILAPKAYVTPKGSSTYPNSAFY